MDGPELKAAGVAGCCCAMAASAQGRGSTARLLCRHSAAAGFRIDCDNSNGMTVSVSRESHASKGYVELNVVVSC